ncbi:unnamed protein product [Blumeria hordei]|uniref:S-adenosylmethionine transporter n=1 Tax=Blumeria hordei TaxID=2867405 RepID=A0A383V040_BLUHO|nr:unnamed protein product [Blumeria hordei]
MSIQTEPIVNTTALLAGALAGTTVDLSLFPLDTLKTRLQSSAGFRGSGGFTGIYRGVGTAIIGSAPSAALFFCTYEFSKRHLAFPPSPGHDPQHAIPHSLRSLHHMLAASLGEIAACGVRVPMEVIKQRAQAGQHKSSLQAFSAILSQRRKIGLHGVGLQIYRGWSVTIMREVPFTIIQFPLWESMKERRRKNTGKSTNSASESALFGSISGATAAGITTPLDVLKTRIMLAKQNVAMISLVKQIWKESGPRAFFSGITPRVVWISAGGAIFLGSYQWAYNSILGGGY